VAAEQPLVVVAGAGGALGRAIVSHYAKASCVVVAMDRNADALSALASDDVVVHACDLADPADLEVALNVLPTSGARIDMLVNAVGLIWNEPAVTLKGARLLPHSLASFERVVHANLTTTFVTSTVFGARMARTGGGVIVNFSSIAAHGNPGQAAYSAAKAGVEGLTRTLAKEFGPLGIRVNAVAPGFIDVTSTRTALSPIQLEQYRNRVPVGRLGSIDDIVQAVDSLYRNGYLNGVVLELDGGLRL
jgi:3-oxoacyl-[acyl-carrier protein] reductase